jgi:hypothetical protein
VSLTGHPRCRGTAPGQRDWLLSRQVRSVFLVTLIPCALSQALCSACALVSAAVLGRLAGLPFGVDILITRDIRFAPAGCVDTLYHFPKQMSCSPAENKEVENMARIFEAAQTNGYDVLLSLHLYATDTLWKMSRPLVAFSLR